MKTLVYSLTSLILISCINPSEIETDNKALSRDELVGLINILIGRNLIDIDQYEKAYREKYPKPKLSSDGTYKINPFEYSIRPSIMYFIDSISVKEEDIIFYSYLTEFKCREIIAINVSMVDLDKILLTTDNRVLELASLKVTCKLTEKDKYSYCFKTRNENTNYWQGQAANPMEFSFMYDSIESVTIKKLFKQLVLNMNNY